MKKTILLAVMALGLSAAAHAQQVIKSEKVSDFTAMELTGNLTVELTRAAEPSVEVRLTGTDISKLDWGVKDGTLFVRLKPGASASAMAEVKIGYGDFTRLKISGANVQVKDTLTGAMTDVDLQAGATFGAAVDMKDLLLRAGGNSVANLTGGVKYLTLSASAKSKINARELDSQDAAVTATSGAEVYVWADERLEISADMGASVFYKGEPEILRSSSKLMATVNSIGK